MLALPLIYSCANKQQSVSIDNLIVGKWQMLEDADSSVNAFDTITFYEDGKMDYLFKTGDFT